MRSRAIFRWPATAAPRSAGSRTRSRSPPTAPNSASRIRHSGGRRRPTRKIGWSRLPAAQAARMSGARTATTLAAGRYFQRFLSGAERFGAVHRRRTKRTHRRLQPAMDVARARRPYRYGGAVRLRRIDRQDAVMIGGWLDGLTRARRPGRAVQRRLHPATRRLPARRDQSAAGRHARHLRQRRSAADGSASQGREGRGLYNPTLCRLDGVDDRLCHGAGGTFSRKSPGRTGRPTINRRALG